MSFKPEILAEFGRQLKRLSKRYTSVKSDFTAILASLVEQPIQGDALGKDYYKVRMAITSKQKGKSGGARIILCVKIVNEKIYFLTIYDKSERENLQPNELDLLLGIAGIK